jgi:hypothetical protein
MRVRAYVRHVVMTYISTSWCTAPKTARSCLCLDKDQDARGFLRVVTPAWGIVKPSCHRGLRSALKHSVRRISPRAPRKQIVPSGKKIRDSLDFEFTNSHVSVPRCPERSKHR